MNKTMEQKISLEFTSCICILKSYVLSSVLCEDQNISRQPAFLLSQWLKATLLALGAQTVTFC